MIKNTLKSGIRFWSRIFARASANSFSASLKMISYMKSHVDFEIFNDELKFEMEVFGKYWRSILNLILFCLRAKASWNKEEEKVVSVRNRSLETFVVWLTEPTLIFSTSKEAIKRNLSKRPPLELKDRFPRPLKARNRSLKLFFQEYSQDDLINSYFFA